MVRDDPLKATKSASGIIGTFLGPRSPGTAYVLLHHYMGEIDGAFRAGAFAEERHRRRERGDRLCGRALGVEIRTKATGQAGRSSGTGRAAGVVARDGEELRATVPDRRPIAKRSFLRSCSDCRHRRTATSITRDPRFRVRGSSGKVNLALNRPAGLHLPARRGPAPPRRDLVAPMDYIERAYDDAKYGPVQPEALHRHDDPDDDRPAAWRRPASTS